ncbi:hypothetical protein QT972_11615 [Microcoleus sp. herbarium7]|uniref:hypothetical protein n=1 Tax=Microcoleus sp. herbarium7 TaxID=3055435 RepID=UPI002FCF7125
MLSESLYYRVGQSVVLTNTADRHNCQNRLIRSTTLLTNVKTLVRRGGSYEETEFLAPDA